MNPYIFAIAMIFWWEENQYFGWNYLPASDAELIADGVACLLLALAIGFGSK